MKIGDMVKVHWGNSDRTGEEDVDWGYAPGIIMGDIRWWADSSRYKCDQKRVFPCGDVDVFVQGKVTSYNIGRCEVTV